MSPYGIKPHDYYRWTVYRIEREDGSVVYEEFAEYFLKHPLLGGSISMCFFLPYGSRYFQFIEAADSAEQARRIAIHRRAWIWSCHNIMLPEQVGLLDSQRNWYDSLYRDADKGSSSLQLMAKGKGRLVLPKLST